MRVVDVVSGPVAGEVADGVVPHLDRGGAGGSGADPLGQPVGLGGSEMGSGAVDSEAGGAFVDVPVGRINTVAGEHGLPAFDGALANAALREPRPGDPNAAI